MLCGKAGFEPGTLGYQVERYDHCATCPVQRTMASHHILLIDPIEVLHALKFVCDGDLGVCNVKSVSVMEKIILHYMLLVNNLHDLLNINQPFGDC
jgi:hypothetical protein